MLKWYDFQDLESSMGRLITLRRKLNAAAQFRLINEKTPRELRLYIFVSRLILKKRILKRRFDWSRNELKVIFSEKVTLQNKVNEMENLFQTKLSEKEKTLRLAVEENKELNLQIKRLKGEFSKI
ncbi:hypothetical protein JWG44_21930 [Leptospira sp. 201903071]|uniref:LIC_10907 family protein n=1 Tax=Leptospira ainazelensis TaxID=2810034 RepID=UPI00196605AB|nr:hypothetical protein [Leptospira ainazelensis]MBM9502916.1 hypothetical protein [Leptospira ainazelensis]